MGEIRDLRDYILAGCPEGDYLFKSEIHVRDGGADIYKVVNNPRKVSINDKEIKIEPINGASSEFKQVHILTRQHLDDTIIKD